MQIDKEQLKIDLQNLPISEVRTKHKLNTRNSSVFITRFAKKHNIITLKKKITLDIIKDTEKKLSKEEIINKYKKFYSVENITKLYNDTIRKNNYEQELKQLKKQLKEYEDLLKERNE